MPDPLSASENAALPSNRCLLGLAEELLACILLELAAADLVTCSKVCHAMADIIERTPAVQYKLQLGLAGMVDGPDNVAPVAKRLQQLHAYQAASLSGTLPIQITSYSAEQDWHNYHDETYIRGETVRLKLSRPASAFTGIPEKELGCLNYQDHVPDPDFEIGNCAVDTDQDLMAVTQLNLGEIPHMYLLSISRAGALHPLAAYPHLEGTVELGVSVDPEESLEIRGDLILWSIVTEVFQIFVYNWKTGRIVWESGDWNDDGGSFHLCPYFLDGTHIVVVQNTTISIHEVHPTKQIYDSLLCELELPTLAMNKLPHGVKSCLQYPPAHSDEAPLFKPDPSLTLLVLRFLACSDPNGRVRSTCKPFLVLIPVSTMLAQVEHLRRGEAKGPNASVSTSTRCDARLVPWKEWSPLGACLIELPSLDANGHESNICTMGSRVLLAPSEITAANVKEDIYVLDAHPLATAAHPTPSSSTEPRIVVKKCIENPEFFADPVHNTLPCRAVRLFPTDALATEREGLWNLRLGQDCLRSTRYCFE